MTDPTFARYEQCKIVAESRYVHYLTLQCVLYQLPVTDFTARVQFMQRLTGWKPFLYDVTVGCNFTRRLNKLTNFGWTIVKNVSNIKHDCPYDQNIFEMKRLENRYIENWLKLLPVPPGDYGILITFTTDQIERGYTRIHFTVS